MAFVVIFLAAMAILAAAAYWGAKRGQVQRFFKSHPQIPKALTFGYIIFAGCFVFPIRSEPFSLDFQGVYLLLASYGVIALALAGILGPDRGWAVYRFTFVFTVVGMVCRYLLEFGEVSNTYNFTPFNVISYLALIPAGTAIAYQRIVKSLKRR